MTEIVERTQHNVKVTVTHGIRVVHDGKVYQDGQSVTVPEAVARDWLHCGWASEGRSAGTVPDPRGLTDVSNGLPQITANDDEPNDEPERKAPARKTVRRSTNAQE